MELDHLLRYLSLVEEVACRLNGRISALGCVLALNLDQALEAAGQVLLHQCLAFFESPSSGIENLGRRGPHGLVIGLMGYTVSGRFGEIRRQGSWNWEAILRQLHSWGDHLFKGHGPVEFQRCHPGIGPSRCHGAGDTGWHIAAEFAQIVVNIGSLGPAAETADFNRLFLLGIVDDDGGHTAEVGPLRQNNVQGDSSCDACVCGVAALL